MTSPDKDNLRLDYTHTIAEAGLSVGGGGKKEKKNSLFFTT